MSGPIGICQVCRNRHELGHFDGRSVCEECYKVMEEGYKRNVASGKVKLPEEDESGLEIPKIPQSSSSQAWNSVDADEKSRYLEVIKGASEETILEVIDNLVSEKILVHDFHKIIQNERWFSIVDLRRIALKVNPLLDRPEDKKVRVNRKGKKPCLNQHLILTPLPQEPQLPELQQPELLPELHL